jgi:hypothetical protein
MSTSKLATQSLVVSSQGRWEGVFGTYVVHGNLVTDENGLELWLLNVVLPSSDVSEGSSHTYWISADEFREAGGITWRGLSTESVAWRGAVVTDVHPAERRAALEAIGLWKTIYERRTK